MEIRHFGIDGTAPKRPKRVCIPSPEDSAIDMGDLAPQSLVGGCVEGNLTGAADQLYEAIIAVVKREAEPCSVDNRGHVCC